MGIFVGPDSLVILGNSAGKLGMMLFAVLFSAIAIHMLNGLAFYRIRRFVDEGFPESKAIQLSTNLQWTTWLPLLIRMPIALFTATGALVSSGFVFNEVFLYWFPGFGFAYLLLGSITGVMLLGRRAAEFLQITAVLVLMTGLILLAVIGCFTSDFEHTPLSSGIRPEPRFYFLPLFLFVGFDVLFINSAKVSAGILRRAMIIGLLTGGLIYLFWGGLSSFFVSREALFRTSIPHIVAARAMGGELGRIIMGIVIICGSTAMINAFFSAVSNIAGAVMGRRTWPESEQSQVFWQRGTLLGLSVCVVVFMASGMAGLSVLEINIQGSFILLLLYYGFLHVCVLMLGRKGMPHGPVLTAFGKSLHGVGAVATIGGAGVLILTAPEPSRLLWFLTIVALAIFICGWIMTMQRKLWAGTRRTKRRAL